MSDWYISPSVNGGYPYNDADLCQYGEEPSDMLPFKNRIWCMNPAVNDGYPFILALHELPQYNSPVVQPDYISVYKAAESDFTHNGERILRPASCTATEELNGSYELTLAHPIDTDGSWKFLKENYIIKAMGQLFRIYSKSTRMNSDGSTERTVNARHIFYDLNGFYIKNKLVNGIDGSDILSMILSGAENGTTPFTGTSDISKAFAQTYNDMSVTYALMGADNSFISMLGGELTRDNFSFSINSRRGEDNAFNIIYGMDMLDISESVDFSNVYQSVHWQCKVVDTDGNQVGNEYNGKSSFPDSLGLNIPFKSMTSCEIEITQAEYEEKGSQAMFDAGLRWLLENCYPVINYTVNIASLKNQPEYADFVGLQKYDLGSTGTIYNEALGISAVQQIVKRTVDCITGEITSIELGTLKPSFTRSRKLINGYYTQQLENKMDFSWANINKTWNDLSDTAWNELRK